jgi:hypothetical protein
VKAWKGPKVDPDLFREQILPGLHDQPIQSLVEATGLSDHYCSLIRLGKRVPHARHWKPLEDLVGVEKVSEVGAAPTTLD